MQPKLKVVVAAGGSDPHDLVSEIVLNLMTFSEDFEAHLFSNSILDSYLDSRFRYVGVGNQLDELLEDADLVLTTASTPSLKFWLEGCVLASLVLLTIKSNTTK